MPAPPPGVAPAPPPAPAAPEQPSAPPAPSAPSAPIDPHQLGVATARLGASSRRNGKVAFGIASVVLEPGEVVEAIVQGKFEGHPGVAVLTGSRVLLVNEAQWKPGVASIPINGSLVVQGWQDDKSASLVFQAGDHSSTIEAIGDRALAQEMAGRVRTKVSEAG